MPRSSLPAAWMKEKAAPGDVRYCGEFCFGQVRGARGVLPYLIAITRVLEPPLLRDLCGSLPLPQSQDSVKPSEGEKAPSPPWPCPTPLHSCDSIGTALSCSPGPKTGRAKQIFHTQSRAESG